MMFSLFLRPVEVEGIRPRISVSALPLGANLHRPRRSHSHSPFAHFARSDK